MQVTCIKDPFLDVPDTETENAALLMINIAPALAPGFSTFSPKKLRWYRTLHMLTPSLRVSKYSILYPGWSTKRAISIFFFNI